MSGIVQSIFQRRAVDLHGFPTGVTGAAVGDVGAEGQWWALNHKSIPAAFLTTQASLIELQPP
jgi:hypothetical protein